MSNLSFAFDASHETPETVRRRRELAKAIAARLGQAQTLGGGIGDLLAGIGAGIQNSRANRGEKEINTFNQRLLNGLRLYSPEKSSTDSASAPAGNGGTFDKMLQLESGGNPNAVSPKGAMGLAQIMPATARDPGYGLDNIFDYARGQGLPVADESDAALVQLLKNPKVNRGFGEAYYNKMLQINGGNEALAAASYNAGPGAVQDAGGIPNFPETQAYVKNLGLGTEMAQAQPQQPSVQPAGSSGVDINELMRALADPRTSEANREVIGMALRREFDRMDPVRQLQFEKLRNPEAKTTDDITEYEYGLKNPGFAQHAGNDIEYGLQPIVTQEPPGPNGEPGKYHLFQAAKDGSQPKEIPLPYGWTPQQQYLDTGLGFQAAPRQGIGYGALIPKNVAEESALRESGKQSEAVPAQVVQDYLKPNGVKEQDDATIASVSAIHEARKLLDRGIQTGALADKLQSLRSIGDALGFEVDERVLTDTQTYQNFIRQTVIPKMKELGGNDSNEELRKMESLSGADIKQQDATIRATLDLTEKLMAKKFKSRELYRKATKRYFGDTYEIPELPVYGNGSGGGWTVLPNGVKIRRKGQ